MTFPKLLVIFAGVLLAFVGVAAWLKKDKKTSPVAVVKETPIEIKIEAEAPVATKPPENRDAELPSANRVDEFFNKKGLKFPFVETITYRSRVPWIKGRPAWLSDYASHFSTSRHFIARSLNGKPDYFKQDVAEGDRFNVLKPDQRIEFYLIVDTSRLRLWFYTVDLENNQRILVKDYPVGLGREDTKNSSGLLTPHGKFKLGSKIAIYKPTMTGWYAGKKVEMVSVFGSRWLPMESNAGGETAPKGLGLHGLPWKRNDQGDLAEEISSLGQYASDGCVRMTTADIEEIFAIVITRPTTVELVKDFHEAEFWR